jgi:hypothetical protein
MRNRKPNAKIVVDLPADEDLGPYKEESLHALEVGNGLYEVLNVPLLAGGLHLHDVVRCSAPPDGPPRVIDVITRSGYGTIHFIPADGTAAAAIATLIQRIRELGGVVERGLGIVAVAVPPEVDRRAVIELLTGPSDRGELSYEADL